MIAPVGGLIALFITGTHFSVSSGVGFLALFGVSVQTGIIMLEYINQMRVNGHSVKDAAIEGAVLRLRPIMMTMLVATLGLLPAALSHGIGSDSQRPFAIVIVGGLIGALMIGVFLLPDALCLIARADRRAPRVPTAEVQPIEVFDQCLSHTTHWVPHSSLLRRLHRELRWVIVCGSKRPSSLTRRNLPPDDLRHLPRPPDPAGPSRRHRSPGPGSPCRLPWNSRGREVLNPPRRPMPPPPLRPSDPRKPATGKSRPGARLLSRRWWMQPAPKNPSLLAARTKPPKPSAPRSFRPASAQNPNLTALRPGT